MEKKMETFREETQMHNLDSKRKIAPKDIPVAVKKTLSNKFIANLSTGCN